MSGYAVARWLGWGLGAAALCAAMLVSAQESAQPIKGQALYVPIYSHMLYGNLGKSGKASSVLLSALVSFRNTDTRRPIRILSAKYFDTNGRLVRERLNTPVVLPPLGTHEVFVDLNDASGGSGANFIVRWEADQPVSPPIVEALHANMDGGKAVIFMTRAVPIAE